MKLFGPNKGTLTKIEQRCSNLGRINSLLGKKTSKIVAMMFPVTNGGSPTSWVNLYITLKEAEKLRKVVYFDGKQTSKMAFHFKWVN